MFVFDGGVTTASALDFELPPEELAAAQFVDPVDLVTFLPPPMVTRLHAAIQASVNGTTVYLERLGGDADRRSTV